MLTVKFYEDVKDELLRFAVVIAKHDGKWVLCKHKERETLEFPGGHRETGVRRINGHKESTQSMKICVLFVCIVLT